MVTSPLASPGLDTGGDLDKNSPQNDSSGVKKVEIRVNDSYLVRTGFNNLATIAKLTVANYSMWPGHLGWARWPYKSLQLVAIW